MTFANLFQKSNSSISQIQGSILKSTVEYKNRNRVFLDTGMRTPLLCLEDELCSSFYQQRTEPFIQKTSSSKDYPKRGQSRSTLPEGIKSFLILKTSHCIQDKLHFQLFKQNLKFQLNFFLKKQRPRTQNLEIRFISQNVQEILDKSTNYQQKSKEYLVGVEQKRSFFTRDYLCIPPKSMNYISQRKLVWTELSNEWRTGIKNRIKGFILNSVNGGYAVALAGYIAFLPKSLCLSNKIFVGQWRQFAILGMNPKIANIVVKEVRGSLSTIRNKSKRRNAFGVDGVRPLGDRISSPMNRKIYQKADNKNTVL